MKTNPFVPSARISYILLSAFLFNRSAAALPVCEVIPGVLATGVSADGKVIIGSLIAEPRNPVRWTSETGVSGLQASARRGNALGVSGDGSVIVGYEASADLDGFTSSTRAFRWTAASGRVLLPYLSYGSSSSIANAVSKNGLVTVGSGSGPAPWPPPWPGSRPIRAVRWDITGPAQDLGDLDRNANVFTSAQATACSLGGQFVYGQAQAYGGFNQTGFQWSAVGGPITDLGVPSGFSTLQISCCDDSGNIFAGSLAGTLSGGAPVACYGKPFVQTRVLGDLPGGQYYSSAKAMSGDGLFVGGFGHVAHANEFRARQVFVWSPVYEMENLNFLLFSLGMPQFAGANPQLLLTEVVGISDSTDVIVCNGFNGTGSTSTSTIRISGLRAFLSGSAPFQINSFYRVSENRVQLSWPCRPGKRYQIQESTNLKDWTNVGDPVTGQSFSLLREVDAQAGSGQGNSRYWRVAQLQN